MTSPDAARDQFYKEMNALLEIVPKTYKLFVLDAGSSIASQETRSNEPAQRLANLPVASAAAANENASVENRWC
ncbi:hypothetical protein SprV_0301116400 [Sparganum proliferum]